MSPSAMNRRRFLALVGGAGGALVVPGCGRDEAAPRMGPDTGAFRTDEGPGLETATAGTADSTLNEGSRFAGIDGCAKDDKDRRADAIDSSLEIVSIADGFTDATVWQDQLVTLRPSQLGASLRFEQEGIERNVVLSDGFEPLCIGTHGSNLVIGGCHEVEDGTLSFQAGRPYRELLEGAGEEAAFLLSHASLSVEPVGHTDVIRRYRPAIHVSSDLNDWMMLDISGSVYLGGAVGAIAEGAGVAAVNRYMDDTIPDSAVLVEFLDVAGILRGQTTQRYPAMPSIHGALWGTAQAPDREVVVVSDVRGTRAMTLTGEQQFALPRFHQLLGVHILDSSYEVSVRLPSGQRQTVTVEAGGIADVRDVNSHNPILHSVSPLIVVASGCNVAH